MRATNSQIEKALNNNFEFGIDGSLNLYNAIRRAHVPAIDAVMNQVKKTQGHFSKSDWKKLYTEIRRILTND